MTPVQPVGPFKRLAWRIYRFFRPAPRTETPEEAAIRLQGDEKVRALQSQLATAHAENDALTKRVAELEQQLSVAKSEKSIHELEIKMLTDLNEVNNARVKALTAEASLDQAKAEGATTLIRRGG